MFTFACCIAVVFTAIFIAVFTILSRIAVLRKSYPLWHSRAVVWVFVMQMPRWLLNIAIPLPPIFVGTTASSTPFAGPLSLMMPRHVFAIAPAVVSDNENATCKLTCVGVLLRRRILPHERHQKRYNPSHSVQRRDVYRKIGNLAFERIHSMNESVQRLTSTWGGLMYTTHTHYCNYYLQGSQTAYY
eukprot:m.335096 g.335096  ORF g.335096 m.335096 type:complete len:187 (+) comp20522_c0_seq5:1903-2463(+)